MIAPLLKQMRKQPVYLVGNFFDRRFFLGDGLFG
jgi:hypothetical protein